MVLKNLIISSSPYYFDNLRAAIQGDVSAGQSQINVSASGFSAGQEVLVIQMRGSGAGIYETAMIASVSSGTTLVLQSPLNNAYSSSGINRAQVVWVPHYQNITILTGATLTAHAWDGNTGGILVFKASQNLIVQPGASIDVTGLGFAGGIMPGSPWTSNGNTGESYTGPSILQSSSANGGGGGGGCDYQNSGGSGGSYGSEGTNGGGNQCANNHKMGYTYGSDDLSTLFLGSGGGSAGGCCISGGAGGGIALINAYNVTLQGSIFSNGADGQNGGNDPAGGAGSGGSIKIMAVSADLSAGSLYALGGTGGSSSGNYGGQYVVFGGNGGIWTHSNRIFHIDSWHKQSGRERIS